MITRPVAGRWLVAVNWVGVRPKGEGPGRSRDPLTS